MKAYLIEHEIEFQRKHDLMPLLELCANLDKEFVELEYDLSELDRYAVAVRYPGIFVKADTAEEAINAAGRVRKFIRKKLNIE